MRKLAAAVWTVLVVAFRFLPGLALPSTSPAFLWSAHQDGSLSNGVKEAVNYQILSSKDLAKSVLSEGGWSDLLCGEKESQLPMDLAILFVGRELQSSDISGAKDTDSALVDLLKVSYTKANFSLAFPYVASSEEAMENLMISEFRETCGHNFKSSKVAVMESCSLDSGNYEKLADFRTAHDYLVSMKEQRQDGQADLVIFCQGNSHSEGQTFSELISSVEQSGARYSVLYVSDPFRSIEYPSYREVQRFLADSTAGSESGNGTCDGVCQIKSSLLEGTLVGIVLLLILISGLCCMMGIDTPTRFEAPQES
ncbi:uncharacterized protein LOC127796654 [Diospyros lotus]|uniref:uncharacterized protein LOC127796654 n=1 Tax=Diospyros lotus TaxID=55363 RepID=UPI00225A4522|nr:uncharacterized protein LOC127796654 [Diospyros lotus]